MKKFLSINEVCKESGLSQHFVRQLIKDNKIPHISSGNKILVNYDIASQVLDDMSIGGNAL